MLLELPFKTGSAGVSSKMRGGFSGNSAGVWIGKVDDDNTPVDCEGPDWTEVDEGGAASIDCGGCCGGGGGCCGCGGGGEDDEFLVRTFGLDLGSGSEFNFPAV